MVLVISDIKISYSRPALGLINIPAGIDIYIKDDIGCWLRKSRKFTCTMHATKLRSKHKEHSNLHYQTHQFLKVEYSSPETSIISLLSSVILLVF